MQPSDAVSTPYSDALEELYDASGPVETLINQATPTATQSEFLNFLQGNPSADWETLGLKGAIQKAASDPDLPAMPVPGTQP